MRAIIIGAGKIGFHIAKVLMEEKHDVVVIDLNADKVKEVEEMLDIQGIAGNGASGQVLEKAGVKEANLLVAVTETDEVNMIACVLAKEYGVAKTVARVRNPEYVKEKRRHKGIFSDIDLIINPELVTAKEIANLIEVPEALDVVYYAGGKIQLLELRIPPTAPVAGKKVNTLEPEYPFLLVAILRDKKMLIPRGDDRILPDDIVFVLAKTKEMVSIEKLLGTERQKAERVMILGADMTGYFLAKSLEEKRISVKIIEKRYERCQEVSQNLEHTLVLHGDGTDIDLLKAEGAGDTDVFVCLTDDDKLNLLVSLLAKHLGTKRSIAQVRRSDYIPLMESVGIDVGVSPRLLTANAILRFIKRGAHVVSVTLLGEARAEMIELVVPESSRVVNRKLSDLNFPSQAIVGSIYRGDQVIIPTGKDYFKPGDIVSVFALPSAIARVEEYFNVY